MSAKTVDALEGVYDDDEASPRPLLLIDIEGFEGPLDLLLELARKQKVDLGALSILALAEQYLAFIDKVQKSNLIVAADYLVMAAWLTYLKSRLLVPHDDNDPEPDGELLADALAARLRRLAALRAAAQKLFGRAHLGEERFPRGIREGIDVQYGYRYEASLHDLLKAYGQRLGLEDRQKVRFYRPPLVDIAEARTILSRLIGEAADWVALDVIVRLIPVPPEKQKSLYVSSFAALLDLAKDGGIRLRQEAPLKPLYVKAGMTFDEEESFESENGETIRDKDNG